MASEAAERAHTMPMDKSIIGVTDFKPEVRFDLRVLFLVSTSPANLAVKFANKDGGVPRYHSAFFHTSSI